MSWLIGFGLVSQTPLTSADVIAAADTLGEFAVVYQVDDYRLRIALRKDGDSEAAVGKAVATLWSLIDEGSFTVEVEKARLGDIDCLEAVRDLEAVRATVGDLAVVP